MYARCSRINIIRQDMQDTAEYAPHCSICATLQYVHYTAPYRRICIILQLVQNLLHRSALERVGALQGALGRSGALRDEAKRCGALWSASRCLGALGGAWGRLGLGGAWERSGLLGSVWERSSYCIIYALLHCTTLRTILQHMHHPAAYAPYCRICTVMQNKSFFGFP